MPLDRLHGEGEGAAPRMRHGLRSRRVRGDLPDRRPKKLDVSRELLGGGLHGELRVGRRLMTSIAIRLHLDVSDCRCRRQDERRDEQGEVDRERHRSGPLGRRPLRGRGCRPSDLPARVRAALGSHQVARELQAAQASPLHLFMP